MAQFGIDDFLIRPAAPATIVETAASHRQLGRPLFERLSFPICREVNVSHRVSALLAVCCPSAIRWSVLLAAVVAEIMLAAGIRSFVVDAVDRVQLRRTDSHVGGEIGVAVTPAVANVHASASVAMVLLIRFVVATMLHGLPCLVFGSALGMPVGFASASVVWLASTRLSTEAERERCECLDGPALASAFPLDRTRGFRVNPAHYRQKTEDLAREIMLRARRSPLFAATRSLAACDGCRPYRPGTAAVAFEMPESLAVDRFSAGDNRQRPLSKISEVEALAAWHMSILVAS